MQTNHTFRVFILLFTCTFLACNSTKTLSNTVSDPHRFAVEIDKIRQIPFDSQQERIVFTGSSSIRFWPDISAYYPTHQIINTGFGGSQMSDLLYYLEETVLRFAPTKVFIYEGDNDIAASQAIETILKNTKAVVKKIEQVAPDAEIIIIAAKPSLARWELKEAYIQLNQAFKTYVDKKPNCHFANVWDIMLDENGEVLSTIFIEDGLHMNRAGYKLWDKVIRSFVVE